MVFTEVFCSLLDVERIVVGNFEVFQARLDFLLLGIWEPPLVGLNGSLFVVLVVLAMLVVLPMLVVLSVLVVLMMVFPAMIRSMVTSGRAVRRVQKYFGRDISAAEGEEYT